MTTLDAYESVPAEIKELFAALTRRGERVRGFSNAGTRGPDGEFPAQETYPFTIQTDRSGTSRYRVTAAAQRELADLVDAHNALVAGSKTYEGDTLFTVSGFDQDGELRSHHVVAKTKQDALNDATARGMRPANVFVGHLADD